MSNFELTPTLEEPNEEELFPEKEAEIFERKKAGELYMQLKFVSDKVREIFDHYYEKNDLSVSDEEFIRKYDHFAIGYFKSYIDNLIIKIRGGFPQYFEPFVIDRTKEKQIFEELDQEARSQPQYLEMYTTLLRNVKREEHQKLNELLKNEENEIDQERIKLLDDITIDIKKPLSNEQIERIRSFFPSGNYLFHTTNVENALMIFESGSLKTAKELSDEKQKEWGQGGDSGISFNMNDVRVLRGDPGHFIGFLTSPEQILDEDTELEVPFVSAAKFEVQYVKRKREKILPKIYLDQTIIFINEKDAPAIKSILAKFNEMPVAILVYPSKELRTVSWIDPIGDHEAATKCINSLMQDAKLSPSINWLNLFEKEPKIENETFVRTPSLKSIIMDKNRLKIIPKNLLDKFFK